MADIFLFQAGDMTAGAWSQEQLEATYGKVQIYSSSNTELWSGTGGFGSGIDTLLKGYGFNGNNPRINEYAGYINGKVVMSVDNFDVPSSYFAVSEGETIFDFDFMIGHDYISGSTGDDVLKGFRGWDDIWGNAGSDTIIAGNGRDIIWGGTGADRLYGDFGLNTFKWEDDGYQDYIYVKSDQWNYNWLYGKSGNSPNGEKADIIYELDSFDRIAVQGVDTSTISFDFVSHDFVQLGETYDGIGIYASGVLEAVYIGSKLNISQIEDMTFGVPL